MKTRLAISSFSLILTACAVPRYDYVKQGISPQLTVDVASECKYQIGLQKIPAIDRDELLKSCMQAKGFRLKQVN